MGDLVKIRVIHEKGNPIDFESFLFVRNTPENAEVIIQLKKIENKIDRFSDRFCKIGLQYEDAYTSCTSFFRTILDEKTARWRLS